MTNHPTISVMQKVKSEQKLFLPPSTDRLMGISAPIPALKLTFSRSRRDDHGNVYPCGTATIDNDVWRGKKQVS